MSADSISTANAANASRQPIATVLVADDNRDMVEFITSLLQMANYNVIGTCSVQDALNVLDERADVELVLSDIRMPEYTGFDLYRVMRHRWPNLPIVLVTGFNIAESDVVPRGAVIVQKPFTFSQLDDVMKQQLSKSRSGGTRPQTVIAPQASTPHVRSNPARI
jgi:DNA-binding NtrC family response regulator